MIGKGFVPWLDRAAVTATVRQEWAKMTSPATVARMFNASRPPGAKPVTGQAVSVFAYAIGLRRRQHLPPGQRQAAWKATPERVRVLTEIILADPKASQGALAAEMVRRFPLAGGFSAAWIGLQERRLREAGKIPPRQRGQSTRATTKPPLPPKVCARARALMSGDVLPAAQALYDILAAEFPAVPGLAAAGPRRLQVWLSQSGISRTALAEAAAKRRRVSVRQQQKQMAREEACREAAARKDSQRRDQVIVDATVFRPTWGDDLAWGIEALRRWSAHDLGDAGARALLAPRKGGQGWGFYLTLPGDARPVSAWWAYVTEQIDIVSLVAAAKRYFRLCGTGAAA